MKKIAIGCQGGGMHAAFEVGVLTEILKDIRDNKRFELVGLSGTSAGALCALMVWYGLAPKPGSPGSADEAIDKLNDFWEDFVAGTGAETALNLLTYGAFWAEEKEIPVLGGAMYQFSVSIRTARSTRRSLPACRVSESASNILIWRPCSRKHVRISITSSGKNKNTRADRRFWKSLTALRACLIRNQ